MLSMIKDYGEAAFCPFVDDHMGAGTNFESLFDLLHLKYFPRVTFGPVYVSGHKTSVSVDSQGFGNEQWAGGSQLTETS